MGCKILIVLTSITFGLLSCSPYKMLKKNFLKGKASIDYLHGSTLTDYTIKQDEVIYVAQPNVLVNLPEVSEIKKVYNQIVPLLVFTQWNHQYDCTLGKSEIQEDLPSFLKSTLMDEGRRRGYNFSDKPSDQSLQLEMTIQSANAHGPYVNSGFFAFLVFFYVSQTIEEAGPGSAESSIHFVLKKNNEVIHEETVTSSATFELLIKERRTTRELHTAYRANLAELLGNTFEQNINKILARLAVSVDRSKP